jgi:hypothetical protein
MKTNPHRKIKETRDYNDVQIDSWEITDKKLNIATSHAPSRFKAQNYLRKYIDDFRIITLDAHFDIGNSELVHTAWLTQDLVKRTAVVGGWSEGVEDTNHAKNLFPYITNHLNDYLERNDFINWLKEKKVYITIDLDFFPSNDEYLGLSSFWHRNLFIGHSMNIKQRMELLDNVQNRLKHQLLGVELKMFNDIHSFFEQKRNSIHLHMVQIKNLFKDLRDIFRETSAFLISLDLVEYSPICDWKNLTINEFKDNFHVLNDLLNTFNE